MIFDIPTIGVALPTESDWGRLYKFDGTGDAGIIMPPRSYYFRDFFPGGWSELAIGLIHAATATTGETDTCVDEIKVSSTFSNLFHFGMSQSLSGAIDVANNRDFIGLRGRLGGSPQVVGAAPSLTNNEFVCLRNTSEQHSGSGITFPLSDGISGSPFTMVGLKFVYNRVTGRLHLFYNTETGVSLADEAANVTKLTTFLNAFPSTTVGSVANFAISDLSAYKSYFIFWPYVLNRLKLHCVGSIKYA